MLIYRAIALLLFIMWIYPIRKLKGAHQKFCDECKNAEECSQFGW